MALLFEIAVDTNDIDPKDRCYYDFVDYPIEANASDEEIRESVNRILNDMSDEDNVFGTKFKRWFYEKRSDEFDMMCDLLWDAIDEYVQDELTREFKKN